MQELNTFHYRSYVGTLFSISISYSFNVSILHISIQHGNNILPLIEHGHTDFGENKVQEALEKWSEIKSKNNKIKLHLIGKLQTNKVKISMKLFDFIHSLDNEKLARKISEEQKKQNIKPKLFVQVNIGNEPQKNGIDIQKLVEFLNYCKELDLNLVGLMCIPPIEDDPEIFFSRMNYLKKK